MPYIPYVQFGTYELGEACYEAMGDNRACILGNHGLLSTGKSLSYAMDVAEQIEFCCQLYYSCRVAGREPILLTDEEMEAIVKGWADQHNVKIEFYETSNPTDTLTQKYAAGDGPILAVVDATQIVEMGEEKMLPLDGAE